MHLAIIPRFPLCQLPTPLERADHLESLLGRDCPRIFVKRDDLTGLAFGGNKGRKLDYLVADAIATGATTLVSEGVAQSNHARMTAAAAAVAGLRCVLILDSRHGSDVVGNLLLDHLFGAEVRLVDTPEARAAEMAAIDDELRAAGEVPYIVPTGGSVPLGATGYVAAVAELTEQLLQVGEAPRRLYHATGSLGTQAGLVVGKRAFSSSFEVYGVAVSHPREHLVETGVRLANETAAFIGLEAHFDEADVVVDGDFVGEAYGIPTAACREAIRLVARTEGIVLDPVYSGKAMSALVAHVRAGHYSADDSVVFLHTGGGPSIFAHGAALLEG